MANLDIKGLLIYEQGYSICDFRAKFERQVCTSHLLLKSHIAYPCSYIKLI